MVITRAAGDETFLARVDDFFCDGVKEFGQNFGNYSVIAVGYRNGACVRNYVGAFFWEKMEDAPVEALWEVLLLRGKRCRFE